VTRDAEQGESKPAASPFVAPGSVAPGSVVPGGAAPGGERAPIGLRIQGRYRIVSELGTGDFGTVCVAEDEATGHPVAVRLLPRGLAAAPQAGHGTKRACAVGFDRTGAVGANERGTSRRSRQ